MIELQTISTNGLKEIFSIRKLLKANVVGETRYDFLLSPPSFSIEFNKMIIALVRFRI